MDNRKYTIDEIVKIFSDDPMPPEIRKLFGEQKKKLVLSMMEASFSSGMTYAQQLSRERRDLSLLHQEWLSHKITTQVEALYDGGNEKANLDKIFTL